MWKVLCIFIYVCVYVDIEMYVCGEKSKCLKNEKNKK